ncbi:hypothetical protein AwErysi_05970 [Erysipelotrichaceae bacterium]|nr:hypothetical protein AwErysi_05970 [Erysipelotrichaceae bacterium]
MEKIKLDVKYGLKFKQGIYPIIKSMMYLGGMVICCNPDAKLMKDIRIKTVLLDPKIWEM